MLRSILAPNPSPMTLDGTRTYLVGRDRIAVIDPGPLDDAHLGAIERAVRGATVVAVLVTHGHPDHAAGAPVLAERLGAPVRAHAHGTLRDGDAVETDAGELLALHTPGHTRDHVCFEWRAERAVFVGDMMMGGQPTALVAPPEGDLSDYLESLERLRALRPRALHPAHGPSFDQPAAALSEYVEHRARRERAVLDALRGGASREADIVKAVYGEELAPGLVSAARGAVRAYLAHLERSGRVAHGRSRWTVKE